MAFTPLHDRVVVRRVEGEEKTAGGLIIPESAKEKPAEGEVVSVGAGARDEGGNRVAMDVKAGDRVMFGKWSGTEVTINGEELLIMKESDILGILCLSRIPDINSEFRSKKMAAKDVKFGTDARNRMLKGVNILADAVK